MTFLVNRISCNPVVSGDGVRPLGKNRVPDCTRFAAQPAPEPALDLAQPGQEKTGCLSTLKNRISRFFQSLCGAAWDKLVIFWDNLIDGLQNRTGNKAQDKPFSISPAVLASGDHPAQVKAVLNTLPAVERRMLERFFRRLLTREAMGYVLLGVKPMGFTLIDPANGSGVFEQGWRKWQKVQSVLPLSPDFIFRETPHHYLLRDKAMQQHLDRNRRLVLIHKPAALQVMKRHWGYFAQELGKAFPTLNLTPERVLEYLQTDNPVSNHIFAHDGMFGILLGFGGRNAQLFHRERELKLNRNNPQFPPSPGFQSAQAEEQWINQTLRSPAFDAMVDQYSAGNYSVLFPGFVGDPQDPETREWLERYREARPLVQNLYDSPAFLSRILLKLTRPAQARQHQHQRLDRAA